MKQTSARKLQEKKLDLNVRPFLGVHYESSCGLLTRPAQHLSGSALCASRVEGASLTMAMLAVSAVVGVVVHAYACACMCVCVPQSKQEQMAAAAAEVEALRQRVSMQTVSKADLQRMIMERCARLSSLGAWPTAAHAGHCRQCLASLARTRVGAVRSLMQPAGGSLWASPH
jgi:hypothetical protein